MPTNALFRALFRALPMGVLVANDEGFYVEANEAASELLGRPRDGLVGAHVADVVADGQRDRIAPQWQAFLRDGQQSGILRIQRPDGQARTLAFIAQANLVPGLHCSFLSAEQDPVAETTGAGSGEPGAEGLLTVCAWTRQVRTAAGWVSMERYLGDALGVRVTHGISPTAFDQLSASIEQARGPNRVQ